MSLVEATGGTIIQTSNEEVATVSDIILADAQSGVSVLQRNNIVTNESILIPVDNTMQGLYVTITGPRPRDIVTIFDPEGNMLISNIRNLMTVPFAFYSNAISTLQKHDS